MDEKERRAVELMGELATLWPYLPFDQRYEWCKNVGDTLGVHWTAIADRVEAERVTRALKGP